MRSSPSELHFSPPRNCPCCLHPGSHLKSPNPCRSDRPGRHHRNVSDIENSTSASIVIDQAITSLSVWFAQIRKSVSQSGETDRKDITSSPRLLLPAVLLFNNDSLPLSALIDSGCEQNLIDQSLVQQAQIETIRLSVPFSVSALSGKPLPNITHKTANCVR